MKKKLYLSEAEAAQKAKLSVNAFRNAVKRLRQPKPAGRIGQRNYWTVDQFNPLDGSPATESIVGQDEVADILNISPRSVDYWRSTGKIRKPAGRLGRTVFWIKDRVLAE